MNPCVHRLTDATLAREGPPKNLRVEPTGQTSVEADWLAPDVDEETPIGYELLVSA